MLAAARLGADTFLIGSAGVIAVIAVLTWSALRVRGALLPGWSGAPARLVELVVSLTVLLGTALVLGAAGALQPVPVLVATLLVGIAIGAISIRVSTTDGRTDASARSPREELIAAGAGVAIVGAQWATHVGDAIQRGMSHPDTLLYHGPYAARFVQVGSFSGLDQFGHAATQYYPLNAELLHSLGMLSYGRDVLDPFINLGFGAIALLAAWSIGRRRGVAPLSMLGVVVVLGMPILTGNQPGQASNDLAAAALLLTSIALLFESELNLRAVAFAAAASGLAMGTKLTVVPMVTVLTIGVVVIAWRSRRISVAGVWLVVVGTFGSFWFVRNWIVAGSPVPYLRVHLGPISFPQQAHVNGYSIVRSLTDPTLRSQFSHQYVDGLRDGLGAAWPVLLVLLVAGGAGVAARGNAMERLAIVTIPAGLVGYLINPLTGGINFAPNLRFLSPMLLVGFAIAPIAVELLHAGTNWRRATWFTLAALVVVGATAPNNERVQAWPSGQLALGILVGLTVIAVTVFMVFGRHKPSRRASAMFVGGLAGAAVLCFWFVQGRYLESRYVDAGLANDGINKYFRDVRNQTVAYFGDGQIYPIFGLDLSNRVTYFEAPFTGPRRFVDDQAGCRVWRRRIDGRFRYVVITDVAFQYPVMTREQGTRWIGADDSAQLVAQKDQSIAYRIDGALDPAGCR
jgi:hypothetical protein